MTCFDNLIFEVGEDVYADVQLGREGEMAWEVK
jgi:hypothetical protein